MLSSLLLLTTLLAAGGTFASPNPSPEERWLDVPWIGYYEDGNMDCKGSNYTDLWLIGGELEEFKRPANTAVGVHYGKGSVSALWISTHTHQGEAMNEVHNFTGNVDSDIECYNNSSDWAWSVPWSRVLAYGATPPEADDPWTLV